MINAPIRMLVVEDNPGDVRLLQFKLTNAQSSVEIHVLHVERLARALERLEKEFFDVILLDLSLPDSHGMDTLLTLRSHAPDIPVIVMTGLDDEAVAMRAVQEGAQDYLIKGEIEGTTLLRSIRYAIERFKKQSTNSKSGLATKHGKVIGLMGAKGGAGTTTVALNVASILAREDNTVIALELHPYFGTFATQLFQSEFDESLSKLLDLNPDEITPRELIAQLCTLRFGLKVMCGPQSVADLKEIGPGQAESIIKGVARISDYVVIDLPSYPYPFTPTAVRECDYFAIVVEREPLSVQAAEVLLRMLRSWRIPTSHVGIIVVGRSMMDSAPSLRDIASRLSREVIGVVPPSPDLLVRSHREGIPLALLHPGDAASISLKEIATKLTSDGLMPVKR